MKKYLPATIAVCLAVSVSILQSYIVKPIQEERIRYSWRDQHFETPLNWYTVGSDNKISDTLAVYEDKTKSEVIATDPCKDQVLPNCLFGTNGTVTLGQDISMQPAAQRIRRTN
jgi:hypothetical protein